jgi:hypothetical protein
MVVTACSPAVTSAPQTHTAPAPTQTTAKATPSPTLTPFPMPTDLNADGFGDGYIARVPINDVENMQPEEVLKLLLSKWLEHYKAISTDPNFKLADYKVDGAFAPSGIQNRRRYELVADTMFFIKLANPSANGWMGATTESLDNGWLSIGYTISYFRDGEDFRLRLLPGWGT